MHSPHGSSAGRTSVAIAISFALVLLLAGVVSAAETEAASKAAARMLAPEVVIAPFRSVMDKGGTRRVELWTCDTSGDFSPSTDFFFGRKDAFGPDGDPGNDDDTCERSRTPRLSAADRSIVSIKKIQAGPRGVFELQAEATIKMRGAKKADTRRAVGQVRVPSLSRSLSRTRISRRGRAPRSPSPRPR